MIASASSVSDLSVNHLALQKRLSRNCDHFVKSLPANGSNVDSNNLEFFSPGSIHSDPHNPSAQYSQPKGPSAPIRRAHASPAVAYLSIMHLGVINRHTQPQHLRRQPPDRRQ